jgi:glycosyltransferase involved in cell wall biosynthesis
MTTVAALVSVVIPCHNYGQLLAAAIESALNQTHQPIEVVVVDDGSVDNTREVAGRYPVKRLSQPQLGVCVAINNGVRASAGAFVMRLDADDILEPTYVAETLAVLEREPDAHFAYTEVEYFGAATGTYPIEDFDAETLAERNYIHGSALMRRQSFELVGGFDPSMADARCEDWDLWLAFAERGLRGVRVPKPLLRYRQHAGTSRNTLAWHSLQVWRRNFEMAARLQDNHPTLFATRSLTRRLSRLPGRMLRGRVSPRFALLLVSFYGVMLGRSVWRIGRPRPAESR